VAISVSAEFSRLIESILRSREGLTESEEDLKDYIRLIMTIAKSYVRTRVEYEDLVMQGVVGLLKARKKYDKTRSSNFKPLAYIGIMGEIYLYCTNNRSMLHIPAHTKKAIPYINKIMRFLDTFGATNISEDDKREITLNLNTELEDNMPESTRKRLRSFKDKISSIARNSSFTYEVVASMAYNAYMSSVVRNPVDQEDYDTSVEDSVGKAELRKILFESLGEKRYTALRLHFEGHSNPEISAILFKLGLASSNGRPISRTAIRSLIDKSLNQIFKMEIYKNLVE
jgi:RNA polymerase sigma factor (sigma-70 family)